MYFFILILQTIIITTKWPFPFWKQPHHFREATKMLALQTEISSDAFFSIRIIDECDGHLVSQLCIL